MYGKVVHINIKNATCDSYGRVTGMNVLSNFKPINNEEIGYLIYGAGATMGIITVDTNGDLILRASSGVPISSQPYCNGSLTYILY